MSPLIIEYNAYLFLWSCRDYLLLKYIVLSMVGSFWQSLPKIYVYLKSANIRNARIR